MNTLNKIKAIITALVIILPILLNAQDNTFNGTADSNWDEAANWSTGKVPPANIVQKITIAADCVVPATNSTDYTFVEGSTFEINSGITFTNNGTGTWTVGGTFDKDGTYIGDLVISGDIEPGTNVSSWACGDPLVYGGQSYATVQIGGQCWMAENLNIGTMINSNSSSDNQTDNNVIEKYCYDNIPGNCDTYGGLYQWGEMMQYVTVESTQGVCPTGWHLPSDGEWTTMTDYVSAQSGYQCNSNPDYIAKALAATTNWTTSGYTCDIGNDLSANNATGFTVLPAGFRFTYGSFWVQSDYAVLWSSSESGSFAWGRSLFYYGAGVYRYDHYKASGVSVRCVRD